jgi:hypothetical protein
VKLIFHRWFAKRKNRIQRRLDRSRHRQASQPQFTDNTLRYELSDKAHAISCGGIGLFHTLVQRLGLARTIDERLHLLKIHMPYHESDHVLNIAYNALCDGTCLQDIELRRNDENFLNALGARSIPDPTTAGDFCRRFSRENIETLLDAINETRLRVWAEQDDSFFEHAILDADGTLIETTGECKQGMDISYKGGWGYQTLIVSLANTGEVLSILNRPGNRPSHEGAARELDRSLLLCLKAGFRTVLLRGDTDFSQTEYLDGWNATNRVRFIFGYNAMDNLEEIAAKLPEAAWQRLERPARYVVRTQERQRPANVKNRIVREREFTTLRLKSEEVAEFEYKPGQCSQTYRMVVVRKNITKEKGEQALMDDIRYFFYITNEREWPASEVVFSANDRCNQENLIAQLKGEVRALHSPLSTLESNWAYMVMTALAWNLKAWWALSIPAEAGRWQERHREEKRWALRLEFKSFLNAFVMLPCQILRTGRRIVYRLLGWNAHIQLFLRLANKLQC